MYVAVMDQNVALILPIVLPMFSAAGHQRRGTQASSAALRGRQAAEDLGGNHSVAAGEASSQRQRAGLRGASRSRRRPGREQSGMGGAQGGAIPIAHLTPEENERRLAEILARHGLKAVPLSDS